MAQHPHVDVALRGGQEVVLTALDDARGARLTVPDSPERARWILYDPERGVVLAEVQSRKTSQVSIRVPPGEIEVYRRAAASVARGTITVAEGDELVLSRDRLTQVSLATYLRKGQAGVSIAAQVGISSFTSPRTNEQFLGALPLMSLGVTVHDVGVYGLDLGVDIGFSSMNQRLAIPGASSDTPFDQRVLEIQVGASLKYRLDFGSFSVSAGPRLGYLYIERAVDVPHLEQQDAHLLAAGAVLSAQWRFSPRISIGLDGRASYVPMPSEGEGRPDRDQFLVELQAAAAFHI